MDIVTKIIGFGIAGIFTGAYVAADRDQKERHATKMGTNKKKKTSTSVWSKVKSAAATTGKVVADIATIVVVAEMNRPVVTGSTITVVKVVESQPRVVVTEVREHRISRWR